MSTVINPPQPVCSPAYYRLLVNDIGKDGGPGVRRGTPKGNPPSVIVDKEISRS